VAELERDVLLLDSWLERQRLEEVLAISDEIRQKRDRLKELMEDWARTGSETVRAELEREMRALERQIAELQAKLDRLRGETEDRFVNADALDARDAGDCLARVRELIDKGDPAGASAQLARCDRMLDEQARAYEDALRGLRSEKFSEEEKALAELLGEIGGLEQDQGQVAAEAQRLMDEYKRRAAELARDEANPAAARAGKILERLRKELGEVPRAGLTPFGQEEHDQAVRRASDVERMLEEHDVAEALAMARQAQQSIETLLADVDDDLADGEPWSDRTAEAQGRLARAEPLAAELVAELERATPSPEQILDTADRRRLDELRRRQKELAERTERLGQKAQKNKNLPGQAGEAAHQGLGEAGARMGRAQERMGARDPGGARDEARGAEDKLASLKKGMQRAARPSTVGNGRSPDSEPVRIPDDKDFKPSEEFREDILEAMKKEKPPEAYRDLVKRYYEELVK